MDGNKKKIILGEVTRTLKDKHGVYTLISVPLFGDSVSLSLSLALKF